MTPADIRKRAAWLRGRDAVGARDADIFDALADVVEALKMAHENLKAVRCPHPKCDNNGTIDAGDHPDPCQWCDQRATIANALARLKELKP